MRDLSRLIIEVGGEAAELASAGKAQPGKSTAGKTSLLGKFDLKSFMGKAARKETAAR